MMWVFLLTFGVAIAQAVIVLLLGFLILCFYASWVRTLTLVMPDE